MRVFIFGNKDNPESTIINLDEFLLVEKLESSIRITFKNGDKMEIGQENKEVLNRGFLSIKKAITRK